MDTKTGKIYPSRDAAEGAGVRDEDLVTGSLDALHKLRARLDGPPPQQFKFTKGSFKRIRPPRPR